MKPPGEERLFDLELDPFEINDLSADPRYQPQCCSACAREMDAWLARVGDWSEEPEDAMVARFEPGGERQVTPAPTVSVTGRRHGDYAGGVRDTRWSIASTAGRWQLYTAPVERQQQQRSRSQGRALRLGGE